MEAAKKLAHDLIEKISEKSLLNIIDIMQAINLRDAKLREDIIEKIKNCQDQDEQKKLWLEWEALLPEEEASDTEKKSIAEYLESGDFVSEKDLLQQIGLNNG